MKYCVITRDDELSKSLKDRLINMINISYDETSPQILVVIGGDGTILKAIHKYSHNLDSIVIYGIHTGHLGFLTNFDQTELEKVASMINSNNTVNYESVKLLNYSVNAKNYVMSGFAFNEVTIINPTKTLIVDVCINKTHLEHFRGTGLCISTPFGSTAYNKSLNGSIIDPDICALQLTEIASINSNAYRTIGSSIVVSKDKLIEIKSYEDDFEVWITVDHLSYKIENFNSLSCLIKDKSVKFACNNKSFIKRVNEAFIK